MIIYILKSSICLALLLAVYHLFLEREKMHQFNRFYLLGSILFSFLAPLIVIYVEATPHFFENFQSIPISEEPLLENELIIIEQTYNYSTYFIGLYILISSILLIRFGKNLIHLFKKIKKNDHIKYKNATIVLVNDAILPHTFWKFIFINKKEYYSKKIEKELFTHELTHVTQKHTIDVLLIEFLQIIFWLNPIFIFLKKAVQLNHEFLADTKVIASHNNISKYQNVLLNKAAWNNEYYLASNLNYSLTKKRLQMMTTTSSKTKILLKKLAVIPLLAGFIFLLAERVEAQQKDDTIETIYEQPQNVQKALDVLGAELPNGEVIEIWEDKEPSTTNNFLASVERTENSILLKCYDCYRWADLKLKLNTEYIINDFGFSEGKTIKRDKYAFTIKATKNQVIFKGLKNTAWKDLKFTLNKDTKQFFNQVGMVSNPKNTQEKVTPEMIAEYNVLAKKYNSNSDVVIKKKEIQRLKYIYSLMTEKQKKSAEKFPNIPQPPSPKVIIGKELLPPPPPPANATQKQLEKYEAAKEEYNRKKEGEIPPPTPPKKVVKGKLVPPPPIPENATPEQKIKYKKAIEKYKKESKNIPPPPKKEVKKPYIDSNGDKILVGHRIANSSILEKDVRHPSVLNYTDFAHKFVNLLTSNDLDFKKLKKLYNVIPLSEKTSLMTPDYILNNKDFIKETTKGYKIKNKATTLITKSLQFNIVGF